MVKHQRMVLIQKLYHVPPKIARRILWLAKKERNLQNAQKMLCRTGSKQFICARCGLASKSVNIHHIEELHQGGENKTENMIPLCGDCHREWDLCHDVGMTFGEFLVSLPSKAWQIATKLGFFKSPHPTGRAIEAVYQVQFSGHAVKYPGVEEDPLAYFKELKSKTNCLVRIHTATTRRCWRYTEGFTKQ